MTSSASVSVTCTPVSNDVSISVPYQSLEESDSKAHHPPNVPVVTAKDPTFQSSSATIISVLPANPAPPRKDPVPEFKRQPRNSETNHPMKCVSATFTSVGMTGIFSFCGGQLSNRFFEGSNNGYWIGALVALFLIACWYKTFAQNSNNTERPGSRL